jgi:hypothetical protein
MKKLILFTLLMSGIIGSLQAVGPVNFVVEEHKDSRCSNCADRQVCIEGKCVTLLPHHIHFGNGGNTLGTSSGSSFVATRNETLEK